ncbi:MAG: hypothetical protein EOP04_23145 [Proteobacteria bacterium]|nr:MAG: hypothetical protein EOP04_23145 [Pseudomonadota bacterium]
MTRWKTAEKLFLGYYHLKSVQFDSTLTQLINPAFLSIRTPFVYSGFWDVPLLIRFEHVGKTYFLNCEFSDDLDEYWDYYEVYEADKFAGLPLKVTEWPGVEKPLLGRCPIESVKFDVTRRKYLDETLLKDELGIETGGHTP